MFTKGMRISFAVKNITDPIEALRRWMDHEITTPFIQSK